MASPTVTPPEPRGLNPALARNIAALQARREADARHASHQDRLAEIVTAFSGTMAFVYVHLAVVAVWIVANAGLVRDLPRFDPSFVILATTASVEAIFLSTFVLISQNRAAKAADQRADLDLQINLLSEHEVTRLISLTRAIAAKLGVEEGRNEELSELERDVAPEAVLDELKRDRPLG
jgi:uncharacterized membrane protein